MLEIKRVVLTPSDIKEFRREFGYTQQNLADNMGVGKSYISQLESGKKELTDTYREKLTNFFTVLAKNKLDLVAKAKLDSMTKRDKYLEHLADIGNQKEYIKEIAQIRKQNGFKPSFDNVSCDMIWMQTVLIGEQKKLFEDTYIHTEMRTDIEYYPKRSFQRANIDFSYLFTIHCRDGKITVGYGVKGNDGKHIPKLVVQFNPNKVNMEYNADFHMLCYCLGADPIVTKIDYCRDYEGLVGNQIVVTDQQKKRGYRREESNGVTHYIGNINCNGIRVYDKRAEVYSKDGYDLGYNVVRYEHRRQICRYETYDVYNKLDDTVETKYSQIKDVKLSEMSKHIGYSNLPTLSVFDIQTLEQTDVRQTYFEQYYIAKAIFEGNETLKNAKAMLTPNSYDRLVKCVEMATVRNLHISEVDMIKCNELMWHRYNSIYEKVAVDIGGLVEHQWLVVKDLKNKEGKKVGSFVDNKLYDDVMHSDYMKEFMNGVVESDGLDMGVVDNAIQMTF